MIKKPVSWWLGILFVLCLLVATAVGCAPAGNVVAPPSPASPVLPSLSQLVNQVLPSVVYISVETMDSANAAGSGVVLRSDGYILTNRHVVENAKKVEVELHDRRAYPVSDSNIWIDDIVDLAVVKIDESNLPVLQFGNPDSISVGDWVIAVGHALGLSPVEGGATVTDGIVSNLGRSFSIDTTTYYDVIQTSAAINPGNSGGPLVNMTGEVIGVNSAGVTGAQNIAFAIDVGTARHVFEDLVQYGRPHHPYLGVRLGDITPDIVQKLSSPRMGALITSMGPRSPAVLAGLQENDVIVSFGDEAVDSAADLVKLLWRHEPGDRVEIVFWRGGVEMKKSMTLELRTSQTDAV